MGACSQCPLSEGKHGVSTKRGKRREREIITKERKKKIHICSNFQLRRGCTWSEIRQADLHKTTVEPLSRASPDHSGASCHSPSLQTSCSLLHLTQQILPREEERHKQIQQEFFLKPQVTDFRGTQCQADRLGPGEQPQLRWGKLTPWWRKLPPCHLCSLPTVPGVAPACSWVAKAQHPLRRLGGAGSQQRQLCRRG